MENYLGILERSLQNKLKVLDEIAEYNQGQEELLKQETVSMEELDANMEKKDALIQKLTELDKGFEALYARIKEQLQSDKSAHKEQIGRLQKLISRVTEKSVSIQAQEARNKELVEKYFAKQKAHLRQGRQSSKGAYNYYKNMSGSNVVSSQFMDHKQ